MQRRTSSRAEFFQPFDGQLPGVGNVRWFSANLGVGGVFLRTNHPLPAGSTVTLRLPGAGAPLEVEGRVVWRREFEPISISDGLPGMAIRFRRASFEVELRIRQLLAAAELERTGRKRPPPPPPAEALAVAPAAVAGEPVAAKPGQAAELAGIQDEPEPGGQLLAEEPTLAPDAFDLALAESYARPSPAAGPAAVIPVVAAPEPAVVPRLRPARRPTARLLATVGTAAALLALSLGAAATYSAAVGPQEPPDPAAPQLAALPAGPELGGNAEPVAVVREGGLAAAAAVALPAAASAAPVAAAPVAAAPVAAAPVAAAPVATAPLAPAAAPRLLRPELARAGSGFELSIRASGPVAVRHFPLRQPSRLVFDVPASAAATLPAKLKLPAGAMVRIGRHGATSRVVVEFPGPLPRHEVRVLPDGVVLSISR